VKSGSDAAVCVGGTAKFRQIHNLFLAYLQASRRPVETYLSTRLMARRVGPVMCMPAASSGRTTLPGAENPLEISASLSRRRSQC